MLAKTCSQCDSIPPYCLTFIDRLVVVFSLEGLAGSSCVSYTRENAWTPVHVHEIVRGSIFRANCLQPASIQTSELQNRTTFDILMHVKYRKTQDVEDRAQFFKE